MGEGGGGGNVLFSVLWFLILIFVSLLVAGFCAEWYILLYCFAACCDCLRQPADFLLKGVQFPHTCAINMIAGNRVSVLQEILVVISIFTTIFISILWFQSIVTKQPPSPIIEPTTNRTPPKAIKKNTTPGGSSRGNTVTVLIPNPCHTPFIFVYRSRGEESLMSSKIIFRIKTARMRKFTQSRSLEMRIISPDVRISRRDNENISDEYQTCVAGVKESLMDIWLRYDV